MGKALKLGVCAVALAALPVSEAAAKHVHKTSCASPTEVTAIAATSIQQELMVAALTCNQIANFNAFQTNFGDELRSSDRALLHMFTRLYGGRGQAEYHGFKTRLANNSEIRSIHGNTDYCATTTQVFAAALAPNKPSLSDFVSGVTVVDPSPVNSCQMQVPLGLQGAMAAPNIVPRQKPAAFEDVSLVTAPAPSTIPPFTNVAAPQPSAIAAPAAAAVPAAATPAAATAGTAPATAPATASATPPAEPKKRKSFFGLFD